MNYKQNFKSPILKALVGKQRNLPRHLQDAIKAAPESPANMKDLSGDGKVTKKDVLIGRGVLDKDGSPAKQSVLGFNENSKAAENAAARRKTKTSIPPSLGGSATQAAIDLVKKGVKNQKDVFGRAGYGMPRLKSTKTAKKK